VEPMFWLGIFFKSRVSKCEKSVFLKFGNTVKMHHVATDYFCKVKKKVYSISINFSKFGFRFLLVTLY
jgi:hypothetical protein